MSTTSSATRRFTFSPKVTPFQPSPSLSASEGSYGTGTAATTPFSMPADLMGSPSCSSTPLRTPSLNPTARPFVPVGLAPACKRPGSLDVSTLLAMRGRAADVKLGSDVPFAVQPRQGAADWVEQAARRLEQPASCDGDKPKIRAMTALDFLRSSDPKPVTTCAHEAALPPVVGELAGFSVGPGRASILAAA